MINISFKRKNLLNFIFFLIYIIIYLFTLEAYGMGSDNAKYRYFVLVFAIIISGISIIKRKGLKIFQKENYGKELLYTIIIGVTFLLISIIKANSVDYELNIRTFVQISLIIFPALYVFEIVNIFSIREIIDLMKLVLFFLLIAYFSEKGHRIWDFLNLTNYANIDIAKSNSFTESNLCSEGFLQLFLFFNYFRHKKDQKLNIKSINVCCIVSFIFTILSFKRLGMLFASCVLLMNWIIKEDKEISSKVSIIMSVLFTVLTIVYTQFMKGEIFTNIDVYNFTTGRDYILSLWEKQNYFSYGFGTSMLVINRYLEMDLVQIYMELNELSVFIFCFCIFSNCKKSLYAYIVMLYVFLNLLTASSLPYSLGWIILLTTIVCMSSDKYKNEMKNLNNSEENREFNILFSTEEK